MPHLGSDVGEWPTGHDATIAAAIRTHTSLRHTLSRLLGREQEQSAAEPLLPLVLQDTTSGLQVWCWRPACQTPHISSWSGWTWRSSLHYDRHQRRWRSELEEAEARRRRDSAIRSLGAPTALVPARSLYFRLW